MISHSGGNFYSRNNIFYFTNIFNNTFTKYLSLKELCFAQGVFFCPNPKSPRPQGRSMGLSPLWKRDLVLGWFHYVQGGAADEMDILGRPWCIERGLALGGSCAWLG